MTLKFKRFDVFMNTSILSNVLMDGHTLLHTCLTCENLLCAMNTSLAGMELCEYTKRSQPMVAGQAPGRRLQALFPLGPNFRHSFRA